MNNWKKKRRAFNQIEGSMFPLAKLANILAAQLQEPDITIKSK